MIEQSVLDAIKATREKKKKSKRLKKFCIRIGKFFISTAGLGILNIALFIAGAIMFEMLEKPNELQECINARNDFDVTQNATLTLLMDMTQGLVGRGIAYDAQKTYDEYKAHVVLFAEGVLDSGHDTSKVCEEMGTPNGTEFSWGFTSSLLFAVTIGTTIGKYIHSYNTYTAIILFSGP